MSSFKASKVERSLKKKGFRQEPKDHKYFILYIDGKRTSINTHTSHCGQDIDDFLIGEMKKQLKLNKEQFKDLINCPLSQEEYINILKEKGDIDL